MKCIEFVIDGFGILSTTTSAERKAWLFHSQDEVRQTVALRTIRFFCIHFRKTRDYRIHSTAFLTKEAWLHLPLLPICTVECVFITNSLIGVDVMRCDFSMSPQRFTFLFNTMRSNFHPNEQSTITFDTFYRYWTLKEAYLKAIGVGLGHSHYDPGSLDFSHILDEKEDQWITLGVRNVKALGDWLFYTTRIDEYYMISIACGRKSQAGESIREFGEMEDKEVEWAHPKIGNDHTIDYDSFQMKMNIQFLQAQQLF